LTRVRLLHDLQIWGANTPAVPDIQTGWSQTEGLAELGFVWWRYRKPLLVVGTPRRKCVPLYRKKEEGIGVEVLGRSNIPAIDFLPIPAFLIPIRGGFWGREGRRDMFIIHFVVALCYFLYITAIISSRFGYDSH
jgi:hypothetical protein